MFARVSTYRGAPDRVENGIRQVEQTPIQELPDFKGAYLLVNRESGKAMTITLWESQQAMQASAGAANPLRSAVGEAFGDTQPPTVETYEVALSPVTDPAATPS